MLAPITDLDAFIATRRSWHTLAERVLGPARHRDSGHIGLRATPSGFATPAFGAGRVLAVAGTELLVTEAASTTRHPITTLRSAAAAAGIEPGAETGVYVPTTPSDPDAVLPVDADSAARLGDWINFGAELLGQWRRTHAHDTPTEIQLWPEHFDLALDLGAEGRRANYGASPGDADHPLPYVYVGPWNASDDPFWNAGTYARLGDEELVGVPDPGATALAFFARGYEVAEPTENMRNS